MANVKGQVVIGPDHLLISHVPIVAPAGGAGAERGGEELIRSLDLRVEKGEHTLITGPKYAYSRYELMSAVWARRLLPGLSLSSGLHGPEH